MTIESDIASGKIGKKEEKLIGWDYIKKPLPEILPPLRARGAGLKEYKKPKRKPIHIHEHRK